jgi:broad specificity phosphatase PhoE
LGQFLCDYSPIPTCCYSSPLLRARQTADYLIGQRGIPLQLQADLQELNAGILQGLTWPEAVARYPDLCHRLTQTRHYVPVPEAETLTAGRQRAGRWLAACLQQHQPGQTLWVVSHGGLMQHLVAVLLGCDRTWQIPIGHTALFEVWLAQTHWQGLGGDRFNPEWWQIRQFNVAPHLNVRTIDAIAKN